MTTAYDVPAKNLIDALSKKLQTEKEITPPEWSRYVKTGVSKDNPPDDKNWWHIRCASILRKIYVNKGIGIERLKTEYGGKQNKGSKPSKAKRGSGSVVRHAVQQLEKAGYDKNDIHRIGNIRLVTANANQRKSYTPYKEWIKTESSKELELTLIPDKPEDWDVNNYKEFVQKREQKILEKIKNLL